MLGSRRPDETWETASTSTRAARRRSREKTEKLERRNAELKLRVAGLSRSVRELGEANAELKAALREREGELGRARARVAALSSAVDRSPPAAPAVDRQRSRDERRKLDEVAVDLVEARRRERRAVELGSALRRRVSDERANVDRAEERCRALEAALSEARAEADRERERAKRERAAAAQAKRLRERLEQSNADLRTRLDDETAIAVETKCRFAAARKRLEAARDAAATRAHDEKARADAARDECLALKAQLAARRTSERAREALRRERPDREALRRERPDEPPRLGDLLKGVPRDEPLLRHAPKRRAWSVDDDDDDVPPEPRQPPKPTNALPRGSHGATEAHPRGSPEPAKTALPQRAEPPTARFERLQATFDRIASSARRK